MHFTSETAQGHSLFVVDKNPQETSVNHFNIDPVAKCYSNDLLVDVQKHSQTKWIWFADVSERLP